PAEAACWHRQRYPASLREAVEGRTDPWALMKAIPPPSPCTVAGLQIEQLEPHVNFRRGYAVKHTGDAEDRVHVQRTACMCRGPRACAEDRVHVQRTACMCRGPRACAEDRVHVQRTACMCRGPRACAEDRVHVQRTACMCRGPRACAAVLQGSATPGHGETVRDWNAWAYKRCWE
ncbi:unnamed protein product, partial [Closterium sp. Naga37s-1]